MKHGGLHIAYDSGKPVNENHGLTLMIFHGLAFTSDIFVRLLPLATHNECRVVLVNRRDYPGAEPYTDAELAQLRSAQEPTVAGQQSFIDFMRDRSRETYTLLEEWVLDEGPPVGSIVLAFWSMAPLWLTALLAYAAQFETENGVDVASYIRRVVAYDPVTLAWGYHNPPELWTPLGDHSIPPADLTARFAEWVTGYYFHGTDDNFADRTALAVPPPSITTMTPREIASGVYDKPAAPDASEGLIWSALPTHDAANALREAALYFGQQKTTGDGQKTYGGGWESIELRFIWCDRSVWTCAVAAREMTSELGRARTGKMAMRKVVIVRWRNANHFPHWDFPERTLQALLTDEDEDVDFCAKLEAKYH